jgi:hypothetical protein
MSTIPLSAELLAVIGSPCPYYGQAMQIPDRGRQAETTSSRDRKGIASTATAPWSAAAATTIRAPAPWVSGSHAYRELATLAPIMWQRSLSVV